MRSRVRAALGGGPWPGAPKTPATAVFGS